MVLSTDYSSLQFTLVLQAPEREVAAQQLEMLRQAMAEGRSVRLYYESNSGGVRRIIGVGSDTSRESFGGERMESLDGFVESLSLLRQALGPASAGSFAHVRFTTAPAFVGSGNTVSLAAFTPVTLDLMVPKGSLAYQLVEAGLRDGLRMRLFAVVPRPSGNPDERREDPASGTAVTGGEERLRAVFATAPGGATGPVGLALAAELLAPLASASRPVWINIWRESLDRGPDAVAAGGTPSSDLSPRSLRDLRLPYPAVWRGLACFNEGVYRFQLNLPSEFALKVDGAELPLHESDSAGVQLAHACLEGDHEVTVEIAEWRCDYEFVMDVFRLR
jgi:hypothetical protein